MPTRRYGDDEVREIFDLATTGSTSDRALPAESGGLTLDELKVIAQEAGIEPARVAQAAASLDARGTPIPVKRSLGLPVGLSRVVQLPRAPTDHEWELLVTEFRSTFGVQGQLSATGGLRQWSVGNLHICVEPSRTGHQLRLTTRKEDGAALNGLGLVVGAMAVIFGAVVAGAGKPDKALVVFSMFGAMSLALLAANAIRLPRWAREREAQMAALAEHAVRALSS